MQTQNKIIKQQNHNQTHSKIIIRIIILPTDVCACVHACVRACVCDQLISGTVGLIAAKLCTLVMRGPTCNPRVPRVDES